MFWKHYSCLTKRPRQTVQTQIRLLLTKQSDQGLPVCYSGKHLVISSSQTMILFEKRKSKVYEILEHLPYQHFDNTNLVLL